MATINLTPSIIKEMLSVPEITNIVWDRIASPKVRLENWEEAPNPKIALRQMWWEIWMHRYLFLVDADDIWTARDLAIIVRDYFTDNVFDLDVCEWLYAQWDWTIVDTENDDTKKPQVIFYLKFEIPYE